MDRFLLSPDWISSWPGLTVQHLLKVDASDHLAISLSLKGVQHQNKPHFMRISGYETRNLGWWSVRPGLVGLLHVAIALPFIG